MLVMIIKYFLQLLVKIFPSEIAYAHCDIPCGIYDPHAAQMAAHTVIRMTILLNDLQAPDKMPFSERKKMIHQISRLTRVKEEHAEIVKHEIRVLWGDYFKEEHLKAYPNLHALVFKIMKTASKARQEINIDAANELLENVQKIAEIFYKTKGVRPMRVKSVYPTGLEIISYQ